MTDLSPSTSENLRRMIGLNRLSIQSKMILLLLTVSLLSIGIVAWVAYSSAKESLRLQIENQLTGIRVAKTTTLKSMLEALRDEFWGHSY